MPSPRVHVLQQARCQTIGPLRGDRGMLPWHIRAFRPARETPEKPVTFPPGRRKASDSPAARGSPWQLRLVCSGSVLAHRPRAGPHDDATLRRVNSPRMRSRSTIPRETYSASMSFLVVSHLLQALRTPLSGESGRTRSNPQKDDPRGLRRVWGWRKPPARRGGGGGARRAKPTHR